MKFISSFLCLIFLASCASTQTVDPVIGIPSTIRLSLEPTSTILPPTQTATAAPTITLTSTPTPCDPRAADYCITDGHFILQRPILPPANDSVDRTYPFASTAGGTRDPHRGVEFVNELGIPVHAAGDGVVVFAGPDDAAIYSPWRIFYGNLVVIEHDNDLFTLYAHLSKIIVEAGDVVEAGEQIGEVGRSGVAIGSHLHLEVRRGDAEDYFSMVNPELWLLPSQPDFGTMELSIVNETLQFQKAAITIQRLNESNEAVEVYYLETYHASLALGNENAAIGDLPAGRYRISLIFNGHLYNRLIEVQSGRLASVVIVVE